MRIYMGGIPSYMESTGEKIEYLRKQAGISQEQMSFDLGVSRQTISQWEADKQLPRAENLRELSRYFNVDVDFFMNEGRGVLAGSDLQGAAVALEPQEEEEVALADVDVYPVRAVSGMRKKAGRALLIKVILLSLCMAVVACTMAVLIGLFWIEPAGDTNIQVIDGRMTPQLAVALIAVVGALLLLLCAVLLVRAVRRARRK